MCKGGLRLHKFISNNKEVVESTPMELHTKEIKELDLNHNLLPPKHVLGVEWNIENDAFKFHIILKNKPLIRHGILYTVNSIYDPLGLRPHSCFMGKEYCSSWARKALAGMIPSLMICGCRGKCGEENFSTWR